MMNRYPLWKYLLIVFTIAVAAVYSLPSLFGRNTRRAGIDQPTNHHHQRTGSIKVDARAAKRGYSRPTGCLLWTIHWKCVSKTPETRLSARHHRKHFGQKAILPRSACCGQRMDGEIKANPMFWVWFPARRRAFHHAGRYESGDAGVWTLFGRHPPRTAPRKIRSGLVRRAETTWPSPCRMQVMCKALPQLRKLFPESNAWIQTAAISSWPFRRSIRAFRCGPANITACWPCERVRRGQPLCIGQSVDCVVVYLLCCFRLLACLLTVICGSATAGISYWWRTIIGCKFGDVLDASCCSFLDLDFPYCGTHRAEFLLISALVELTSDNINDAQPSFDQMGATCRQSELGQRWWQHFRRTWLPQMSANAWRWFWSTRKIRGCNRVGLSVLPIQADAWKFLEAWRHRN